jgi:hypothetical protein
VELRGTGSSSHGAGAVGAAAVVAAEDVELTGAAGDVVELDTEAAARPGELAAGASAVWLPFTSINETDNGRARHHRPGQSMSLLFWPE